MTPITPYLLKIAASDPHDRPVFVGFLDFLRTKKIFFYVDKTSGTNAPVKRPSALTRFRELRALELNCKRSISRTRALAHPPFLFAVAGLFG